ncbi:MAG: hypothetical protein LUG21_07535 [Clostridiales bacterium]|nr:hypothetical protein [Clostridiales bacterium]
MNEIIENGDYVLEENALKTDEYSEIIYQDIIRMLKTDKGSFYPDKNFGSKLTAASEKPINVCAVGLAREAVLNANGVYIKSVCEKQNGFNVTVVINGIEREVLIEI